MRGEPKLELDIGGEARMAEYSSAEGSEAKFRYTVAAGDNDEDGAALRISAGPAP